MKATQLKSYYTLKNDETENLYFHAVRFVIGVIVCETDYQTGKAVCELFGLNVNETYVNQNEEISASVQYARQRVAEEIKKITTLINQKVESENISFIKSCVECILDYMKEDTEKFDPNVVRRLDANAVYEKVYNWLLDNNIVQASSAFLSNPGAQNDMEHVYLGRANNRKNVDSAKLKEVHEDFLKYYKEHNATAFSYVSGNPFAFAKHSFDYYMLESGKPNTSCNYYSIINSKSQIITNEESTDSINIVANNVEVPVDIVEDRNFEFEEIAKKIYEGSRVIFTTRGQENGFAGTYCDMFSYLIYNRYKDNFDKLDTKSSPVSEVCDLKFTVLKPFSEGLNEISVANYTSSFDSFFSTINRIIEDESADVWKFTDTFSNIVNNPKKSNNASPIKLMNLGMNSNEALQKIKDSFDPLRKFMKFLDENHISYADVNPIIFRDGSLQGLFRSYKDYVTNCDAVLKLLAREKSDTQNYPFKSGSEIQYQITGYQQLLGSDQLKTSKESVVKRNTRESVYLQKLAANKRNFSIEVAYRNLRVLSLKNADVHAEFEAEKFFKTNGLTMKDKDVKKFFNLLITQLSSLCDEIMTWTEFNGKTISTTLKYEFLLEYLHDSLTSYLYNVNKENPTFSTWRAVNGRVSLLENIGAQVSNLQGASRFAGSTIAMVYPNSKLSKLKDCVIYTNFNEYISILQKFVGDTNNIDTKIADAANKLCELLNIENSRAENGVDVKFSCLLTFIYLIDNYETRVYDTFYELNAVNENRNKNKVYNTKQLYPDEYLASSEIKKFFTKDESLTTELFANLGSHVFFCEGIYTEENCISDGKVLYLKPAKDLKVDFKVNVKIDKIVNSLFKKYKDEIIIDLFNGIRARTYEMIPVLTGMQCDFEVISQQRGEESEAIRQYFVSQAATIHNGFLYKGTKLFKYYPPESTEAYYIHVSGCKVQVSTLNSETPSKTIFDMSEVDSIWRRLNSN